MEALEEEKAEDKKVKLQLVDMIHAQRHQVAEKVEEVKQDNRKVRDEIHQEITEALQRKKEEDALELARKEELIR